MANLGFSASEYENEQRVYEPLPKGEYILKATEAELKETKRGDGAYLAVTFEVAKGDKVGRKIWQNFNIHNPNETAQRIGREQVSNWARACGNPNAQDSDQLLEVMFTAVVGIEKGKDGYEDRNKIDAFVARDDAGGKPAAAPKSTPKAAPASKPAASSGGKKNPWDD